MDVGLRVVRGPDWKWGDTDGGEGHVGTVVQAEDETIQRENTALVCWDNGNQSICRTSISGPFDLRIVDNSFAGEYSKRMFLLSKKGIIYNTPQL